MVGVEVKTDSRSKLGGVGSVDSSLFIIFWEYSIVLHNHNGHNGELSI